MPPLIAAGLVALGMTAGSIAVTVLSWGIFMGTMMAVSSLLSNLFTPDIPEPDASPTYNGLNDRIGNTITEGIPIARCYGVCKIGGNKIRFNDKDDADLRVIVAHCLGEVEGILTWYINDLEWSTLTGIHTKTEYKGTRTQTADGRFTDKASAYRSIAYTAFTFKKNDNQIGYDPNVVVIMQGMKCLPLAGGAKTFSRNPAVILYDWYLNVEGYTAGELDLNAFKSLEALCNAVPAGSSTPRYYFDYNYDADITMNDAKKILWQSFNGRVIMSQGKLKPVWDFFQVANGSGGLATKTVSHAFTEDNIVKDSFTWRQIERPNIVRINYIDSTKKYKKTSVEEKDERDIGINGEILQEESCWFITESEIARRRAKYKFNRCQYADYACELSGFSDSSDLEVYDLVTVTHQLPGWTAKKFIVVNKSEDASGQMKFTLEAYYESIYNDSIVGSQPGYESDLPNPFVAAPVTGTALVEGGFIAGDGSYIPYVTLTFTIPNNPFWFRGQIWVSTDGVNYYFVGNDTSGLGFRIDPTKAAFAQGDTIYVKVLSENKTGVVQVLADVTAVSEYIDGKTALPSDVTGFTAVQIGDIVIFSMNRPSMGTDADFSHFELREGSTWDNSSFIATYTQTKYPLSDFIPGAKTYLIKAVDTSGNKSLNAVSLNITLVELSTQNIYYDAYITRRIGAGAVSNVARSLVFDYAEGFFVAGTEKMDDSMVDTMNTPITEKMWTPGYDSGYLITEVVDIGNIVTGKVFLNLAMIIDPGVVNNLEYSCSPDNISWSDYANFSNGTAATFRYIKFKIILVPDRVVYPQNNIQITGLEVVVDLPTIINQNNNVVIAAGGTAIVFNTPYIIVDSIWIQETVIGGTALIATATSKTITGFTAHVFNTSGVDVGGIIDWIAEGY